MSKDQASLLRAMVQGSAKVEPKVAEKAIQEEKQKIENEQSTFTAFSAKKPVQILMRPQMEVVVEKVSESKPVKSELNIEENKGGAIVTTTEEGFQPLKTEVLEQATITSDEETLTTVSSTNEETTPEQEEVVVEVVKSSVVEPNVEEEVNLQEVKPLAQEDEGIRILAVCSGKGGVGKTNVVLNLAIALKRQGKNPLIIDTDFGFTNIDVLCGVVAPYSLQNVLTGEKELKDIVVEGPEGVKIIPGGNDVIHLNDMSASHKKVFQEQFSQLEDVDVLLIDMGAGVSKTSLLYTMFAQEVLLVVTPEPTSLTDAYSLLKTMEISYIEQRVKVVVNRAVNQEEADRTFKKLEATVSNFLERITLEYISYIHDDAVVSASVKAQIPFLIKHPDSVPAKDVVRLMEQLFAIEQPKKRFKNMQQVLGRLMRVFG